MATMNPFREMVNMQRALDRFFDESWRTGSWSNVSGDFSMDVFEDDKGYTVTANMPGVKHDQIAVRLEKGTLTIGVEIPQPHIPEQSRVLLQERPFGQFSRSVQLPQPVNADHVEAAYADGILTLTLPKSPEAQPKLISIKSNGKVLESKN